MVRHSGRCRTSATNLHWFSGAAFSGTAIALAWSAMLHRIARRATVGNQIRRIHHRSVRNTAKARITMTSHVQHLQINDALILEATRLLAGSLPPGQKINAVLRLLSEWAHLHCGRVLMPNYGTGELQVAFCYGLNRERLQRGEYSVPFNQ